MSELINIFIKLFFPTMMMGIIVYDFFTLTIPNTLNALIFIGFIAIVFITNMPLIDSAWHILTAILVLIVGFGLFAANMFGGGDAKSIAAVAAWFGWQMETLYFLILTALLGGIFALILLVVRNKSIQHMLPEKIKNIEWVEAIVTPKARMPYGVAIGAAGLYLYSPEKWLV